MESDQIKSEMSTKKRGRDDTGESNHHMANWINHKDAYDGDK